MARMNGLFITLMCLLVTGAETRRIPRCQLARILKHHGMNGYHGISLANWVCTAYYESHFNTRAVSPRNWDGSNCYGIFQINSRWWCDNGRRPTANGCRRSCRAFINDDISDDIACAKRVVRDPQGMNAWVAWRKHCKGKNVSKWIRGCKL